MDQRVEKLINLVKSLAGWRPEVRVTESGIHNVCYRQGRVCCRIYLQKMQLKVRARMDWAEKARIEDWDYLLRMASLAQESAVFIGMCQMGRKRHIGE